MTNSQYIEVAEKLWGWELFGYPQGMRAWSHPNKRHQSDEQPISEHHLQGYVNSWQGFGKTVEAMNANKLYYEISLFGSNIHPPYTVYFVEESGFVRGTAEFIPVKIETFIEATHLAALEAVREEK